MIPLDDETKNNLKNAKTTSIELSKTLETITSQSGDIVQKMKDFKRDIGELNKERYFPMAALNVGRKRTTKPIAAKSEINDKIKDSPKN